MEYEMFIIKTSDNAFIDMDGQFVKASIEIFTKNGKRFRLLHTKDGKKLNETFWLLERKNNKVMAFGSMLMLSEEWLEKVVIPASI